MVKNRAALLLTPRTIQHPNVSSSAVQKVIDTSQAGIGGAAGGALIDQKGRFVYYAIHVNPDFADFVHQNGLASPEAIRNADPKLSFPSSSADASKHVVEYKSAWMIVDSANPPANYFVVDALVPHFEITNGGFVQSKGADNQPVFDQVKVALLALHVVFTLPGHPEMIWSTFEHVHLDAQGVSVRDNAPAALDNPSSTSADLVISTQDFPLYTASTTAKNANKALSPADMVSFWNETRQAFLRPDGSFAQTSVFRPYPGSKPDGHKPDDRAEDSEIVLINNNATAMFTKAKADNKITDADKRQFYRLVGATWLDQPLGTSPPVFDVDKSFEIPNSGASTDDVGQALAGEARLGSTAMESFTQFDDGAPNCFSCHDTQKVLLPHAPPLKPKLLNVSHIFSRFVDQKAAPQP
jgi:hypothetical protein